MGSADLVIGLAIIVIFTLGVLSFLFITWAMLTLAERRERQRIARLERLWKEWKERHPQ